MNRLSKLLLIASIAIMLTGIGLAVAQPGSLGDEDETAATPTGEPDGTTTTTAATTTTDGDVDGGPTTSVATPTTGTTDTTAATTPTTAPSDGTGSGSGVGSDGTDSGTGTSDDLADTGGESLILAGVLFGAVGLVLRRRSLPAA